MHRRKHNRKGQRTDRREGAVSESTSALVLKRVARTCIPTSRQGPPRKLCRQKKEQNKEERKQPQGSNAVADTVCRAHTSSFPERDRAVASERTASFSEIRLSAHRDGRQGKKRVCACAYVCACLEGGYTSDQTRALASALLLSCSFFWPRNTCPPPSTWLSNTGMATPRFTVALRRH